MKPIAPLIPVFVLAASALPSHADDFTVRCTDRAAIERVYHSHRLGTKQPFEQAMPRALIEQVVRQDQRKEAVLNSVYGVEITPAMVAAEVERIDTTTRAPDVLAEIKHALGEDPGRFAAAMARPIIVERELRRRFDNDDALHAAQRREAELARESLLAGKRVKELHDVTWKLTPRPEDAKPKVSGQGPASGGDHPAPAGPTSPTQVKTKSRTYTNEATAQLSQVVASADHADSGKEQRYLEELDPQLQKVLRVQLQKAGDVSAVVEMPGGFAVFLAKERTAETLSARSLTIAKRSYEDWLARER